MKLLLRYLCCPLLAVWLLIAASVTIAADAFAPVAESELIAVLQSGQPADKALACKKLALYGGKDSAPELAKLLGDEQLASWARIALEAISDPVAGDALRGALSTLKGKLAIGTIHSIGIRKDTASIDALVARLQDTDADVAGACALALGRIGGAVANKTLRQSLQSGPAAIRSMVAEGCILCAERCLAENKHAESVAIYDEVRAADVPKPRKLEATRGAILARKTDGIPLLIEQLRSTDKKFFQIGLNSARELPGIEVADALAAELGRTLPNRAALVLYALAGRKDAAISPAVLAAAKSADPHMQIAAVGLIGRAGDAASLPVLLEIAADPATNAELTAATKEAITTLPGDTINRELAALLPKADAKTLPILIQSIGERRIEATPALVAALNNPDSSIRTAALTALGETIAAKDLPLLIAQVLSPANADDALAANEALHAAVSQHNPRQGAEARKLFGRYGTHPGGGVGYFHPLQQGTGENHRPIHFHRFGPEQHAQVGGQAIPLLQKLPLLPQGTGAAMVMIARDDQHRNFQVADLAERCVDGVQPGGVRIEQIPCHQHEAGPVLSGNLAQTVDNRETGLLQPDLLRGVNNPAIGLAQLPVGGVEECDRHIGRLR